MLIAVYVCCVVPSMPAVHQFECDVDTYVIDKFVDALLSQYSWAACMKIGIHNIFYIYCSAGRICLYACRGLIMYSCHGP